MRPPKSNVRRRDPDAPSNTLTVPETSSAATTARSSVVERMRKLVVFVVSNGVDHSDARASTSTATIRFDGSVDPT